MVKVVRGGFDEQRGGESQSRGSVRQRKRVIAGIEKEAEAGGSTQCM